MTHPIPQTPDELIRDILGAIARCAHSIERCAMDRDMAGLEAHYTFLKSAMTRLETIKKNTRRY